jgi:HTH-type transcriptional regulator/antitoxin HigA
MLITKSRKKRASGDAGDAYMALVRRFPLKTIKNDLEHKEAAGVISELMGRDLEEGAGDYLDALIALVGQYEEAHHVIAGELTPREALRALMRANVMSQADIGRVIGSESAVSMFLKGDRELSKSQIMKLADRFKVDAGVFIV